MPDSSQDQDLLHEDGHEGKMPPGHNLSAPVGSEGGMSLDHLFRQAFHQLETDWTAADAGSDWLRFQDALPNEAPVLPLQAPGALPVVSGLDSHQEVPDVTFLDRAITAKLDQFELPYLPNDWNDLATRLDDSPLDQLIRAKLSEFEAEPLSADWLDMAEQLDQPAFAHIRRQLAPYELGFRKADWRVFLHKQLGFRPWYVDWRKWSGIVAVFLLFGFLLLGPLADQAARFRQQVVLRVRPALSSPLPNSSVQPALAEESTPSSSLSEDRPPASPEAILPDIQPLRAQPASSLPASSLDQLAVQETTLPEQETLSEEVYEKRSGLIRRIMPRPSHWQGLAFPQSGPFWTDQQARRYQLHSLGVGLFGTWGRTRAELSSREASNGFQAGIRVELGITEEVSLITGLQYEERSFSQRFFSFTPSQTSVENLIQAEFQLAEVPLFIRYYIPVAPKVRVYGQTGLVAMVSMKESYQLYQYRGELRPVSRFDGNPQELSKPTGGQLRSLETYVGNVYGGVGVTASLSKRLQFHAEPFALISLQKTKGSGSLGVEKRMYQVGVGAALMYYLGE